MRPGQAAPECEPFAELGGAMVDGFNEAGAGCPGMPRLSIGPMSSRSGFNEAGAGCPGMPQAKALLEIAKKAASMRPGQAAPECDIASSLDLAGHAGFNEAGAGCPGMRSERLERIRRHPALQ